MSGCLICQRPDICSTTSLESIRTSTSAPRAIATAASRPAISPEYSATLLVARPMLLLSSASTSRVAASRTTAPYPAGPGFPREPPSASMRSRRVTSSARWRAPERGGADRVLGTEPVVEAEQVVGNLRGDARAAVAGLRALLLDLGQGGVAAR